MKKIMVCLCVLASLIYAECQKSEYQDKMTDEKTIFYNCVSMDKRYGISLIDRNGAIDYSNILVASKTETFYPYEFVDNMAVKSVLVRFGKNKAFQTYGIVEHQAHSIRLFFDKIQQEEFKATDRLLIEFQNFNQDYKIIDVKFSGLKNKNSK